MTRMGLQSGGQMNILFTVSGNEMANIFYMAHDECVTFLFGCKDHTMHVFVFKLPLCFKRLLKRFY